MTANTQGIDLTGRVAIVTGASAGLGREFAIRLASAGAAVGLIARTRSKLDALAEELTARGCNVVAVAADVTNQNAIERAVADVAEHHGGLDILVNNAARAAVLGPIWETDPNEWWGVMAANVYGPMVATRASIPLMRDRGGGRIINLTSFPVIRHVSSYACSKAALIRFTELVNLEAMDLGVRCFAMNPGMVDTDMMRANTETEAGRRWLPEAQHIRPEQYHPADLVADHLLFLASGRGDVLAGREVDITDELDDLVHRMAEVEAQSLYLLRVRRVGGATTGARLQVAVPATDREPQMEETQ